MSLDFSRQINKRTEDITVRLDAVYTEEDSSLSPNLIRLQAKSLPHEDGIKSIDDGLRLVFSL